MTEAPSQSNAAEIKLNLRLIFEEWHEAAGDRADDPWGCFLAGVFVGTQPLPGDVPSALRIAGELTRRVPS